MSSNGSLDFLNMIKNSKDSGGSQRSAGLKRTHRQADGKQPAERNAADRRSAERQVYEQPEYERRERPSTADLSQGANGELIAVIDTETNWRDEVMSVGVVLGDAKTFQCVDRRYYIFEPECMVGGMFSSVMYLRGIEPITCRRDEALSDLGQYLMDNGVEKIMAYNARFDFTHLPELAGFEWYDIMRIAAYKQFNRSIPESLPCCKSGRLKSNYGVEPIMRMLAGDAAYREVHNALMDAVDELKIVELLGQELDIYDCARLE